MIRKFDNSAAGFPVFERDYFVNNEPLTNSAENLTTATETCLAINIISLLHASPTSSFLQPTNKYQVRHGEQMNEYAINERLIISVSA